MTSDPSGNNSNDPAPCDVLPQCPICDGRMETVYERPHQKVCQCVECGSALAVPSAAWHIASDKRKTPPAA
jgi:hypothetical protein